MATTENEFEAELDFTSPSARADDGSVGDMLDASLQRMNDEAEAIMNSIREELFTPPTNKTNPVTTHSDDDGDDDDDVDNGLSEDEMHDDFEMDDELTRLNNVVASIKEDLDAQSVASMTSAISDIDGPPPHYRYNQRTIAMRAQDAEQFLRSNKLYGPGVGGEETNTPLLVFTALVWAVLLVLVFHVKYGAMDENGSLDSLPAVFQIFG
jgi:hypothetical protein